MQQTGSSWPGLVYYLKSENIYLSLYMYISLSLYMYISQKVLCTGSPVIPVLLAWFLTPGADPGAPAAFSGNWQPTLGAASSAGNNSV